MSKIIGVAITLIFMSTTAHASCDPNAHGEKPEVKEVSTYGSEFSPEKVTELPTVFSQFDQYSGKTIHLKARVTNVCRTKGCWMALASDVDDEVRVRFKDYGFFVPVSLVGKDVIVEGAIKRELIEKELAQHFKEDAGASEEEIAQVTGPVYEYTFTASGVRVL
jgi:hypothetical protein